MRGNFYNRLEALEGLKPDHLIVVCFDKQGVEHIMAVQECINCGNAFIKVHSGGDLSDLDDILEYTHRAVLEAVNDEN